MPAAALAAPSSAAPSAVPLAPAAATDEAQAALLEEAYEACRYITEQYAKTFYMGTKFFSPEKQRAVCAVYAWCRRTDDIVDKPRKDMSSLRTELADWRRRTQGIWEGKSYDMIDLALVDTVQNYPSLSIEPFEDMIKARRRRRRRAPLAAPAAPRPPSRNSANRQRPAAPPARAAAAHRAPTIARSQGMVMDLDQNRFETFDELYLYCYRVAGTVGLMMMPIMGTAEGYTYEEALEPALALGVALQLTNILRDVGEDRARQRIYLPQEELRKFGVTEASLLKGMKTDKYLQLVKWQIDRERDWCAASPAPPARAAPSPSPPRVAPPPARPAAPPPRPRAPPPPPRLARSTPPHSHPHPPPSSPRAGTAKQRAGSDARARRPAPHPRLPRNVRRRHPPRAAPTAAAAAAAAAASRPAAHPHPIAPGIRRSSTRSRRTTTTT